MKRYIKSMTDLSREVIRVRDELDAYGEASTTNKQVADMYIRNKNSNYEFNVSYDSRCNCYYITIL